MTERHRDMPALAETLTEVLRPMLTEMVDAAVRERIAELEAAVNGRKEWLTFEEAGERLGCSPDAVRKRAERGRLESRHHGRRHYVSAESVSRLGGGL